MNKLEQLIEYVINDDESKARELFHEIVVEKSREIYESLMDEEAVNEADENEEEDLDESFGDANADASDNLIDDVEADEESGMAEGKGEFTQADYDRIAKRKAVLMKINPRLEPEEAEEKVAAQLGYDYDDVLDWVNNQQFNEESEFDDEAEEDGEELTHDIEADHDEMGGEEDLEDRVVDLEDKLDELMAEFESMMGGDEPAGDDVGDDMGGDSLAVDDAEAIGADDGEEMTMEVSVRPMGEAINLKAAPTPVTSEEGGINKKSTVAANAGARGAMASPVKMTGDIAQGRPAPGTKELIGKVGNSPAQSTGQKLSPATKPHLAQATGVNTKSPLARG